MPNNVTRANRIVHVIKSDKYYLHVQAIGWDIAISELLTDCMHLAGRQGLDFEHVCDCARIRYEMEKRGVYNKVSDELLLRENERMVEDAKSSSD